MFTDTATTEIYTYLHTLSLRDALPICSELYDEVTHRIVAELEAGRFPWVQPWDASPNLPRNALSGRRYSGVNVLLLWAAGIEGAYPSASWLTFRQALQAGGNVKKGERGTNVVYADRFIPDAEKAREIGRAHV